MATYPRNLTTLREQAAAREHADAKRRMARALSPPPPGLENRQPPLTRRWAVIKAVNTNGTVNIQLDGATVQNVAYFRSYAPTVGDVVVVDFLGADPVVIGTPGKQWFSAAGTLPDENNAAYARMGVSGGAGRLQLGNSNSNGVLWELDSLAGTPAQLRFFTSGSVHGTVDTNGDIGAARDLTAGRGVNHKLWVVAKQTANQSLTAATQTALANLALSTGNSSMLSGNSLIAPTDGIYAITLQVQYSAYPTYHGAVTGITGAGWDWRPSGNGNGQWTFGWPAAHCTAGQAVSPSIYSSSALNTIAGGVFLTMCKVG